MGEKRKVEVRYVSEEHEHTGTSHAQSGKTGHDLGTSDGEKLWGEKIKLETPEGDVEVELVKERDGKVRRVFRA